MNLKATALLAAFDHLPAGALIVEIGCARFPTEIASDGWSTVHLARAATERGWRFHSVDIDPNAVGVASDLLHDLGFVAGLVAGVSVSDGATWLAACSTLIHGLYLDGAADPEQALTQYEAAMLADDAVVVIDDVQTIGEAERGKGDMVLDRLIADGFGVEIVDTVEKGGYQMAIAKR